MRAGNSHNRATAAKALTSALALAVVGGCSTTEMSPTTQLPASPPPYVQVPHPTGYAMSDLSAIFLAHGSPKLEELKDCDSDFKKLKAATQAQNELNEGARELVRRDPVKYHWCFYGKIIQLENDLKVQNYLDEKQKSVLGTYGTLTPMGRAFMEEYHDSRYLRWAIKHYRQVSEWVFYRKVELTPQATSELVEAANPFGMLRQPSGMSPVLEKYNLTPSIGLGSAPGTGGAPDASAVDPEQSSWENPPAGPPPFPDHSKFPEGTSDAPEAQNAPAPPHPNVPMKVTAPAPKKAE